MHIDGPKYRNPVVLSKVVPTESYTSLLSSLPEHRFKNRIVGFTDEAVYACTKRTAKSGYYEMICEPFAWKDVSNVFFGRSFSVGSVVLGVGFIVLGIFLFYAGWIAKTHTGPAILWIPFAAPLAGLAFIFGARRLQLIASIGNRKLWWAALPLFKHEAELFDRLNRVPGLTLNECAR